MKAGQNTIVRWVAKLVVKDSRRTTLKPLSAVRMLDTAQLRQVSGGTTDGDLPYKGW